jgi:putative pyoverdin transport system ATP-binding/permease protein
MRLISLLLRYSRKFVILAIIAGIISGIANTGLLALINAGLNDGHGSRLIIGFAALCTTLALSRIASELLLLRLGQGALFDLRMNLSSNILAVPLRKLEEIGDHKLLSVFAEDIPAITNVINIIPIICINIAVVIACLVYMGSLSFTVLLKVLGLFVLGIFTYQLGATKTRHYLTLAREESNSLFKHLKVLMGGVKELKLHRARREMFLSKVLRPTASRLRSHNVTGMTVYTLATGWGQLLVFITIGLLLFVMPKASNIDATSLTGFTLAFLYIVAPLQMIMNSLPVVRRGEVALRNVENLGLTLLSYSTEKGKLAVSTARLPLSSVEMVGVTLSYKREGEDISFALGPIDLTLGPGEVVFLVGGNGSGKTTLAKVLTGLYLPESGTIYLNGEPVTGQEVESLRQYFSAVFSDFHLFDSLLGVESPQLDAQARSYLSQLKLSHKVNVKDGVLSTTELSQGQRKRLALLIAYLEDRPIYVFDEWAADQDITFKEIFYLRILPELKARGKAVLVISHDEHYYHVADRVIKVDNGRIIEHARYSPAL